MGPMAAWLSSLAHGGGFVRWRLRNTQRYRASILFPRQEREEIRRGF
jgi:hypothetical protein